MLNGFTKPLLQINSASYGRSSVILGVHFQNDRVDTGNNGARISLVRMVRHNVTAMVKENEETEFTEEEQKKRDKLLHKLLKTPPQSREDMKKSKAKAPQKTPTK